MQHICIHIYIKRLENTWTPFYTVCPVCDLNYKVLKLGNYVFESRLSFGRLRQNLLFKVREYFFTSCSTTRILTNYFSLKIIKYNLVNHWIFE